MNFGRCLPKRAERRECVNAKDECLLAGVGPPDGKRIKMKKQAGWKSAPLLRVSIDPF